MRLPADATLIVVGEPDAGEARASAKIAALAEAWRQEDLPALGLDAHDASHAFADGELERRLDEIGATTLVVCGEGNAVEATAREAAALGFHAFIVVDACWTLGRPGDFPPTLRSGEWATVVDTTAALEAAATAKARQRQRAQRLRRT